MYLDSEVLAVMNVFHKVAVVAVLSASTMLLGQSLNSNYIDADADPFGGHAVVQAVPASPGPSWRPFSKVGFGVGVSPLGVQLQATTNLMPHFNLRTTGNVFSYSTNFTTSGINASANLNMKSAGAAVDIYPFHRGFRVSPGVLIYNGNQITATANVPGGTSFTLNNQTYYSANANPATGANPVNGNALLNLHTTNPAFTLTTGWGNTLPAHGHWSFPFEVGVAFTGAPSLNVNLGGWACYDKAQKLCTDISSKTDPIALEIQTNLHAQVNKWANDIEPLKTYPIAAFGVAYNFSVRNQ
jgi:hypothetical protein